MLGAVAFGDAQWNGSGMPEGGGAMQARLQRISPFLWFDTQAEEAAKFYVSVFDNSRIIDVLRYDKAAAKAAERQEGAVMTVAFELDGQSFVALNGGPIFNFTEAISLVVNCRTQAEVDRYWQRLSEGGDPTAQQCGWLKDKFGLSWQVVPTELPKLVRHPKAMQAMLGMRKIDLEVLRKAAAV
jgi:predicted 3-demethylubiquinone-9 3-methyltransferase (glyoxalase superfamily)